MKTVHFLLAVSVAMALSGCSRFSKSHFYEKSFGIDLNKYVESYESSYTDGVLEVYDVNPTDDLYKNFFEYNTVKRTTDWLFEYKSRRYSSSIDSPIIYVESNGYDTYSSDGYSKYVLYLTQSKTMVFIYADGVGG